MAESSTCTVLQLSNNLLGAASLKRANLWLGTGSTLVL